MNFHPSRRPHHHNYQQAEPENARGSNKPEQNQAYFHPYYNFGGDHDDDDRFVRVSDLNSSPIVRHDLNTSSLNHYEPLRSMGDQSTSSWANIDVTKVDVKLMNDLLKDLCINNDSTSNDRGGKRDPTAPKAIPATTTKKRSGCRAGAAAARDDSSVCFSVSSWGDIDIDVDDQPTLPNRPSLTSDHNAIHRRRRQSHPMMSSPPPPPPPPPPRRLVEQDARDSSWGDAEIFVPPTPPPPTTINNGSGKEVYTQEEDDDEDQPTESSGSKARLKKKPRKKKKTTLTAEIKQQEPNDITKQQRSSCSRRWSTRIDSILSGGHRLKEARRTIQERRKSSLTTTTTTAAATTNTTTATHTVTTSSKSGQWTKL